jgi:16S rRNA (cytosine1402-N4)-methyltransferase
MHISVLQKETVEYLDPKPDQNFIDCTIGGGGHTFAILEKNGPTGKILGIDWSAQVAENIKRKINNTKYRDRVILVCDNFANLKEIVKEKKFGKVSGILLDLGMSSWHLEESKRGFSFREDESLDMRYGSGDVTAEKIINSWPETEIERILKEYGQERFAKKIAAEIVKQRKFRPIKNTLELVEIIKKAMPPRHRKEKIHFATRTFQALRIAVNDELDNLKKVLPQAIDVLERDGRLVVISFHSLEDGIVKSFLKENSKGHLLNILTKKPVGPSIQEQKINPRSRSARLRAAIKS